MAFKEREGGGERLVETDRQTETETERDRERGKTERIKRDGWRNKERKERDIYRERGRESERDRTREERMFRITAVDTKYSMG